MLCPMGTFDGVSQFENVLAASDAIALAFSFLVDVVPLSLSCSPLLKTIMERRTSVLGLLRSVVSCSLTSRALSPPLPLSPLHIPEYFTYPPPTAKPSPFSSSPPRQKNKTKRKKRNHSHQPTP